MASHLVVLFCWIIFIYCATHFIKIYFDNAVDYKSVDPEDIGVIKVHQFFHQLFHHKTDNFDVYGKNALSFYLTHLKNITLNVTVEQLRKLLKEEPEIESRFFTVMLKLLSSCDCFWRSIFTWKFLWQKRLYIYENPLWKILVSFNSYSLACSEFKVTTPSTLGQGVGMGNENEDFVFVSEIFLLSNFLLEGPIVFFGKLERHNAPPELLDCANTQQR